MKKQKFTFVQFHKAAQDLIEKYFGNIPDFKLSTGVNLTTSSEKNEVFYFCHYRHESYKVCNMEFFGSAQKPGLAIEDFENEFKKALQINFSEITDFDLPF